MILPLLDDVFWTAPAPRKPYAYYNEIDPHAAAWLRELIRRKLIMDGEVDERSITNVSISDLRHFTRCHFFAGLGLWDLALQLAGWPIDRRVWTGSCPCQPFSVAGKGLGTEDERHLWPAFSKLIEAEDPPVVFGEQVASKDGRDWLAGVFADLEGMGYQRAGADLCAPGVGAPHIRQRLYWGGHRLADTECPRWSSSGMRSEIDAGRELESGCPSLGLGDARGEGLEGHPGNGDGGNEPRWDDPFEVGSVAEASRDGGMADTDGRDTSSEREQRGGEQRLQPEGRLGDWEDAYWHYCRDGKHRRVPVEPLLQFMVDGCSDVMGPRWNRCLEEIRNQITDGHSLGEVMRAVWRDLQTKEIQGPDGVHQCFPETPLLLFTLCQLAGSEESEFFVPAPDLLEIQEAAMRAVWRNSYPAQQSSRSSQERRLDGPPPGEPGDALHRLPSDWTPGESGPMHHLREPSERSGAMPDALPEVQEVWRRFVDQETAAGASSEIRVGEGVICALSLFPLTPSTGFLVPGMARRRTVRPALLRGSGNAIVPQVAAQFISAFMEATSEA